METRYKVFLLLVLLLGLGAGAALTTVQNTQQPVPPQFAWTFFDKNGNPIPDIKTATISGTVLFRATVSNPDTYDVRIDYVTLGVFTKPDYSLVVREYFTEAQEDVYELYFDTTTIPDGEYFFEFQWMPVFDISFGNIPMTVLTLEYSFEGGTGSSQDQQTNLPLLLGAGGIGAALVLYVVLRRR